MRFPPNRLKRKAKRWPKHKEAKKGLTREVRHCSILNFCGGSKFPSPGGFLKNTCLEKWGYAND